MGLSVGCIWKGVPTKVQAEVQGRTAYANSYCKNYMQM